MPKYCRAPHCSNAAGQARPPARRLSFYKSVPGRSAGTGGAWPLPLNPPTVRRDLGGVLALGLGLVLGWGRGGWDGDPGMGALKKMGRGGSSPRRNAPLIPLLLQVPTA